MAYLLDQFLWERTNLRADGYGGSLAARTRFPAEVIAAVRTAVGPDYPIIFRFSQWKGTHYATLLKSDPRMPPRRGRPKRTPGRGVWPGHRHVSSL